METKWGENPNLAPAFGGMRRGQEQIGPNIAGIIRAHDSLSDHKRRKSGKVWKGTSPRSEQLRPSLIFTNV